MLHRPTLSALLVLLSAVPATVDPLHLPEATSKPALARPHPKSDPCAAFGPGFVRMPGSDTCVKVGGGIGIEAGGRGR